MRAEMLKRPFTLGPVPVRLRSGVTAIILQGTLEFESEQPVPRQEVASPMYL